MGGNPPSDNVFIADLPPTLTNEECESLFQAYGSVTSCRVLPAKAPGAKACALVRFGSVDEATWICENLNGNLVEGLEEPIQARFANPPGGGGGKGGWNGGQGQWGGAAAGGNNNSWGGAGGAGAGGAAGWSAAPQGEAPPSDNVFIGALPAEITKEECESVFAAYGSVQQCRVFPSKNAGGKASALVRFANVEEATWVIENLNGNLAEGLAEPIQCRFANSPGQAGGKGGWTPGKDRPGPYPTADGKGGKGDGKSPGSFFNLYGAIKKAGLMGPAGSVPDECQVFIRNLPADTTDLDLYKLFAPFGAIAPTGVKAMTNPDGSCKGIAFVDFADATHAELAIQTLNGFATADGTMIQLSTKRPSKGGKKGGGKGKGKDEYGA